MTATSITTFNFWIYSTTSIFSTRVCVSFKSQEAYLCAWIQLMEMVLIHILFLQRLKRLCKIRLTAGWEHSCRERRRISTLELLLLWRGQRFCRWAVSSFSASSCFKKKPFLPPQSEQVCYVSDGVKQKKNCKPVTLLARAAACLFSATLTIHTADLTAMRTTPRQEIPHRLSVNTDDLLHTFSGLCTGTAIALKTNVPKQALPQRYEGARPWGRRGRTEARKKRGERSRQKREQRWKRRGETVLSVSPPEFLVVAIHFSSPQKWSGV